MKHLLMIVLLCAAGCGDGGPGGGGSVGSYDEAADLALKAMKEYEGILEGIKDKASGAAAKPKLEAMAKRLRGIAEGASKLKDATEEDMRKSEAKMQQGIASLSQKSTDYTMRVLDNPEIAQAVGDAFPAVQNEILKLRGMLGG
ncbi:MAG TPA: hypothetical protein VFY93_06875 [Planctomycetota bacterium]|nr:hypothetical protein [Planctomycetota bacterium]